MSICFRIIALSIVLTGAFPAHAAERIQTRVYRCQAIDTTPVFQSVPCAATQAQTELQLVHTQPDAPASQARARGRRPASATRTRSARPARRLADVRETAEPTPRSVRKSRRARARAAQTSCPATREASGDLGRGTAASVWKRYQQLPSRTYLKNAGLWPAHCPD